MSNQNATVNRVTLLESIEAARRSIEVCWSFHTVEGFQWDGGASYRIAHALSLALWWMREAENDAAVLEAWGDGP